MAKINNSVVANFEIAGQSEQFSNISNNYSIQFKTEKSISVERTLSSSIFVPGNQITFTAEITNTGSSWFSGVRVIDDLSGIGYLTYVPGSAKLLYYGQWLNPQIADVNPLTFTLSPLSVGQTMVLKYTCTVNSNIPDDIENLVSSLTAIGYTYNSTAQDVNHVLLTRSSAAFLKITKDSDIENVCVNQPFNYVITLSNSSDEVITLSSLEDNLPSNFVINQITLKVDNGAAMVLNPTDYVLSQDNKLTIPSATGPSITVPARFGSLNGTTIVSINGYFNK